MDLKKTQDKFLKLLASKRILDFGCGSGRDTKYFVESGFDVAAIDGSEELCKSASVYTGIQVKHALYSQMETADWERIRTQLQEDLENYYSEMGGV